MKRSNPCPFAFIGFFSFLGLVSQLSPTIPTPPPLPQNNGSAQPKQHQPSSLQKLCLEALLTQTANTLPDRIKINSTITENEKATDQDKNPRPAKRPRVITGPDVLVDYYAQEIIKSEPLYRETELLIRKECNGIVNNLLLSQDGSLALSYDKAGSARIYSTNTGDLLNNFSLTGGSFYKDLSSAAISPNNRFVAVGNMLGSLFLWNRETNALIRTFNEYHGASIENRFQKAIKSIKFSPCGNLLATASLDKTVKLLNYQSQEVERIFTFDTAAHSLAFSHNARYLAVGLANGTVRVFDLTNNTHQDLLASSSAIQILQFSPNDTHLCCVTARTITTGAIINLVGEQEATTDTINYLRTWNLETQEIFDIYTEKKATAISFSDDSSLLVFAHGNIVSTRNLTTKELSSKEYNVLNLNTITDLKHYKEEMPLLIAYDHIASMYILNTIRNKNLENLSFEQIMLVWQTAFDSTFNPETDQEDPNVTPAEQALFQNLPQELQNIIRISRTTDVN